MQNVIKEDKFRDCNILVASRPHNARKLKKFFHEIVVVVGFAPDKAVTFANRILNDSHKVADILNFKSSVLHFCFQCYVFCQLAMKLIFHAKQCTQGKFIPE